MIEILYQVVVNGNVVAAHMDLDTALLLVKAWFQEYYNDLTPVTIEREKDENNLYQD